MRPYAWFFVLSAAGYAGVAFGAHSERTPAGLAIFIGLFFALGGLWLAALIRARSEPPRLGLILASGLAFRLLLVPAGYDFEQGRFDRLILYDDDVWRYLWEGHARLAGVDVAHTPPEALEEYQLELDSPELFERLYSDTVWSEIWDNIGYGQYASPYPIVANAVFVASTLIDPGNVWIFKLLIAAFDLGSVLLLAGIASRLGMTTWPAAAYAWCPLPIKEFAGSAHIDAVMIFLLLAAVYGAQRWQSGWIGSGALALAALVKPSALAAAPGLVRRFGWLTALAPAAVLVWIALDPPDGLRAYARFWVFNPALPRLLPDVRWLEVGLPLVAAGAAGLWVYLSRDEEPDLAPARSAYWVLGAFLLTTPMLAPWYLCWIIPFAALFRGTFWLLLSISVFLSYHAHLKLQENFALWALEFLLPAAGAWLVHRRQER